MGGRRAGGSKGTQNRKRLLATLYDDFAFADSRRKVELVGWLEVVAAL